MLHPIEILPYERAQVRRGVRLGCELTTNLFGPRQETLVDLSPRGARLLTKLPIERGEYVLLHFVPEGLDRRIETMARVAHVEFAPQGCCSVGLEFVGLEEDDRRDLARILRGVPPPLPRARPPARRELVWLDFVVTWEEDLGDRVNVWEVSERLAGLDDGEMVVESLAPFVTGGRGAYVWKH